MVLTLHASGLRWLGDVATINADQCLHREVFLSVDNQTFVSPDSGDVTLSAAGLYLLRTLESHHLPGDALTDEQPLFPHCGHFVYLNNGRAVITGCPDGVDVSVTTEGDTVTLRAGDLSANVTASEWREAVLGFARQIESFYASSPPRERIGNDFEAAGWMSLWTEWHRRVQIESAKMRASAASPDSV